MGDSFDFDFFKDAEGGESWASSALDNAWDFLSTGVDKAATLGWDPFDNKNTSTHPAAKKQVVDSNGNVISTADLIRQQQKTQTMAFGAMGILLVGVLAVMLVKK